MVAKLRVPVPCSWCGKLVERTPKRVAKVRFVHCSRECTNANPAVKRRKAYLTCEWCEAQFYPDSRPNAANRFCSLACRQDQRKAGVRVNKQRADTGVRKDGTVLVDCHRCQNPVAVPKHRQGQEHYYCSMECFHALGQQINGRKSSHLHRRTNTNGKPYQPRPAYREMQTWDGLKCGSLTREGYVTLHWPDHPSARGHGRIFAHRAVMEHVLGRPLVKGEQVHHLDGDRENNEPSNLMLMISSQPAGAAIEDKYRYCLDFIRQYRADLRRLKEVGAGTSMRESHYAADEQDNVLTLFDGELEPA